MSALAIGDLAARPMVFDERCRFGTFVEGPTTRDAVDAVRTVVTAPGARWNPLLLAGAPGVGKSHLLGAAAHLARERRAVVHCASALNVETLPNAPLASGALLLVDDVRASLPTDTLVVLRRLVDDALLAGAQVVLALDAAAVDRDAASAWIAHCARARLVRLGAPDVDTRCRIVRSAASARGLALADDALDAIARDGDGSVRELLNRLSRTATSPTPTAALGADDDFASFLAEVEREVAAHVEPWRLRVGEAAARWRAEGIVVDVLERALRLPAQPDVDALLSTFENAVTRLRRLAREGAQRDPSLAGHAAYGDPARLAEAESLTATAARQAAAVRQAAQAAHVASAAPATPALAIDFECWVHDWPDVRDLLVEAWS